MESLLSVVTTFGLSTEDIEGTIIVFVAFMATALSIGGIAFSFKIADVATKTIYQKGMGLVRGAGRAVTTPVKGIAKVAGKGVVEDWRSDQASQFDPNKTGAANTARGILAGGVLPGRRRMLKIAGMANKYEQEQVAGQSAALIRSGVRSGTGLLSQIRGNGLQGLDLKDPYMTRAATEMALRSGNGDTLHAMWLSPRFNHDTMLEVIGDEKNYVPTQSVAPGMLKLLEMDRGRALATAGTGGITSTGLDTSSPGYNRLAELEVAGLAGLSGAAMSLDKESLGMVEHVYKRVQATKAAGGTVDRTLEDELARISTNSQDALENSTSRAAFSKSAKLDFIKGFAGRAPAPPPPPAPTPAPPPPEWREPGAYK